MAWAVCSKCGGEYAWRAGRGMRLADWPSPCCRAPGHSKTHGRARVPVRYAFCEACGRRRSRRRCVRLTEDVVLWGERRFAAGAVVCTLHEVLVGRGEARNVRGFGRALTDNERNGATDEH